MDNLIEKLRGYLDDAEAMMTSAKTDNDRAGFARLLREARECVVRLGQLQGAWSEKRSTLIDNRRQTVNLSGIDIDELRALRQSLEVFGVDAIPLNAGKQPA